MHKTNKILIVLTSAKDLHQSAPKPDTQPAVPSSTGFDIKEVAYIYDRFCQRKEDSSSSKIEFDIATPKGGPAPIDPLSLQASKDDHVVQRLMKCQEAMDKIKNTQKLQDVLDKEYRAILFPGGPGAMIDLPNETKINELVQCCLRNADCFLAAIGHGIAALINVKDPRNKSEPLLRNKRVTCNTIEEEREMQLDKALPFQLERKLKDLGARFEKSDKFASNVVSDERIITGQNRNSVKEWVEEIERNLNM